MESEPWPMSVAPQSTATRPLRSARTTTPECGMSFQEIAVPPAVEPRAEVHAGDRAVLPEAGLDPHQHRVAPAVDVEDLLAGQGDLHRAPAELRELARRDLVRERVELAAEAAAHRRRDHPDVG